MIDFKQNVILTPAAGIRPGAITPARDGDDISWMHRARVGDDQAQSSACSMFGIANWLQIMQSDFDVSDDQIIAAWQRARMRFYGNHNGGLTVPQAFAAGLSEGWLSDDMLPVPDRNMSSFTKAPLLGCYEITEGWYHTNEAGCIRHTDTQVVGYHLVIIVELGRVGDGPRIIWVQNSWTLNWGYKGCGQITEEYHRKHCKEIWQINNVQ